VIRSVAKLPAPAWAAAFSPNGRRVVWAAGQRGGNAYYFDTATWRQSAPPFPLECRGCLSQPFIDTGLPDDALHSHPRHLLWSPDSRFLATETGLSGPVAVFPAGTAVAVWEQFEPYEGIAWSPDGTIIAAGADAATGIQLFRADDGKLVGSWKDQALTSALAYSPDGSILAAAGFDGTIVLRDVATGAQIGPVLTTSSTAQAAYLSFDAAGHLIAATRDGGLWRWNISLPYLIHTACAIAGRNLTTQEWADLRTGRPYLAACT
jgi:WD40 repeat protein